MAIKSKYDYYWRGEPIETLTYEQLVEVIKTLDRFIEAQRKNHREVTELLK